MRIADAQVDTLPATRPGSAVEISRPDQLPPLLLSFLLVSSLLTVVALLFSIIARRIGLGLPYSFAYYFIPGDAFSDTRAFWYKFQAFGQQSFFTPANGYFMYPVPLVFVFAALFKSGHAFTLFLASLFALTASAVYLFARTLRGVGVRSKALLLFVGATVLLSYPLAFLYLRLNIEILIFILTTAGVVCWWRGYNNSAAILFGIAGACKIYPLIFLGLLFGQQRYRSVALGVGIACIVTLTTLWLLGPTIRQAYLWDAFQIGLFQKRFAGQVSHLGYDHSFFGLIKFFTLPWRPDLTLWVSVYTRTAALCSLLLYFTRIRRAPPLNQLLALAILSITLPPVSFDYTLLALYPPFVLLCCYVVRAHRQSLPLPVNLLPHFLLFACIFTPLSFVIFNGAPYGAQVRAMVMIGLLWLAVCRPLVNPAIDLDHPGLSAELSSPQ